MRGDLRVFAQTTPPAADSRPAAAGVFPAASPVPGKTPGQKAPPPYCRIGVCDVTECEGNMDTRLKKTPIHPASATTASLRTPRSGASRPAHTLHSEWLEVADVLARRPGCIAVLDRHGVTADTLQTVLTVEARGANRSGVSALSSAQIADLTGVSLRSVLLIRAGLFHFGLLSKPARSARRVRLQLPGDFSTPTDLLSSGSGSDSGSDEEARDKHDRSEAGTYTQLKSPPGAMSMKRE